MIQKSLLSSNEMSVELRLRSSVLHLPIELQSLILNFQYKSRAKVRRAAGCERCARSRCICLQGQGRVKVRNRNAAACIEARRTEEARRIERNRVRTERYQAALQQSNFGTNINAYIFQLAVEMLLSQMVAE